MRAVLPVVALVVAVVALAMTFLSGGGEQQSQGSDEVARLKAGVSTLERRMSELRSGLDEVSAQLEDMRAAAASRPQQPSQKPETSSPEPSTSSTPTESVRDLVRKYVTEEIQRYQEEQRKRYEPERWEKKEFGNLARDVYRRGKKLGLSREQKRAYYQILKRFYNDLRELWGRIRSQTRNELEAIRKMREEREKILEQARREVMSLLDAQQRAKYRELIKKDNLFKWYP